MQINLEISMPIILLQKLKLYRVSRLYENGEPFYQATLLSINTF